MHTFNLISKKIIGIPDTNIDRTIFETIHKINYYIYLHKDYSIQNKFNFLKDCLNNIFINEQIYEEALNYFNTIQKTYHAFSRLAYIYKYKKAKIIIDSDLIMNPINENDKFTFCLFQNNCKYLFNIHELIKIINNSIANSCNFFYNPIPIKNPYNNIILNKSTLYNIYFFIKMKTLINAEIFYYFFNTNFNLNNFVRDYQHVLRDFAVQTYLRNSSNDILYNDINDMLDSFNIFFIKNDNKILIDDDFPIDKLIEAMKPYLKIYLESHYSLIYAIREKSKKYLMKQLVKFKKTNPLFGRKIMKPYVSTFGNSNIYSFNIYYISFYEINKNKINIDFMINHASEIEEENYELRRPIYNGRDFDYDNDNDENDDDDDDSYDD